VVIIQCPHCSARFRLDEKKISGRRQLLKCSRCRRVFPAVEPKVTERKSAPPPPPPPSRPAKPEPETLSFTFDDDDEDWRAGPTTAVDLPDEPFLFDPQGTEERVAPRAPEAIPLALDRALEEDDDITIPPIADDPIEEEEEMRGGSISLRPVFVFLFLVVGAYALLARALYSDPEWTRQLVDRVPLMQGDLQGRTLNRKIVLKGVESHYETTKEGTSILLVTGRAHNQSSTALNSIQVSTKLFDAEQRMIGEQLAFCGNSVRPELVRDLTIRQIAVLKSLKPPQRFSIRPDEECSFVTFFTELPAAPATFTSEIAATQAHA
jgi:predicted Zn finger-like uncharacterized protein